MKPTQRNITIILMSLLMALIPDICYSTEDNDSLLMAYLHSKADSLMVSDSLNDKQLEKTLSHQIMDRVWNYSQSITQSVQGVEQNVYMRYNFTTERRNPTLFAIPSMYAIAHGDRQYIGEAYGKIKYHDVGKYDFKRQVVCGTIPHHRAVMSTLQQYMTPNLYAVSLYENRLLSPFYHHNRVFYNYKVSLTDSAQAVIAFRPRLSNTQLVKGFAMADINTGRLTFVSFSANFDMISFTVTADMSDSEHSLLPVSCLTHGTFKFVGNRIAASISSVFNCKKSLPDSLSDRDDRELMATLRPTSLREDEKSIYRHFDDMHTPDTTLTAQAIDDSLSEARRKRRIDEIIWNFFDDNIFSSIHAKAGPASVRMSPLLNPQYLSYSQSKGISYRLNIGFRYAWNTHRYLTLNPQLGYNFKQRRFYYTAPLRLTYNPKRNGYAELTWANGNRINSGALVEKIQQHMGSNYEVPEFKDQYIQAINNVRAYDWLEIMTGLVFHMRKSTNRLLMRELQMPEEYRSFAHLLTVRLTPWATGPTLTANYEWSMKNVLRSNLSYDRWEFDAAYKKKLKSLRQINLRVGTGYYTTRNSNFFVDFNNFRDNNLPTGWDDEWAGQFQLLDSRWYNESDYYIRGHYSYDSPMLLLSWIPRLGRAIEMERIYVSALSIEHTRPYYEVGYGFTNRFFSAAIFGTILGNQFQKIGTKFTLQLFRRW